MSRAEERDRRSIIVDRDQQLVRWLVALVCAGVAAWIAVAAWPSDGPAPAGLRCAAELDEVRAKTVGLREPMSIDELSERLGRAADAREKSLNLERHLWRFPCGATFDADVDPGTGIARHFGTHMPD